MSDPCAKFKVPAGINSSRSSYEWWLRTRSDSKLPLTNVGRDGFNISILGKKGLIYRFRRLIRSNTRLLRYFDRKVMSFARDFRGDLNIDQNPRVITQGEVSALSERLLSREAANDIIIDIALSVYFMRNIKKINVKKIKHAASMREAYFALHAKTGSLVPKAKSQKYMTHAALRCFFKLTNENPKLKMNLQQTLNLGKDDVGKKSFNAMFQGMVPLIKIEPIIFKRPKPMQPTRPKESKINWGRVAKGAVGVALTIGMILLFVLL